MCRYCRDDDDMEFQPFCLGGEMVYGHYDPSYFEDAPVCDNCGDSFQYCECDEEDDDYDNENDDDDD